MKIFFSTLLVLGSVTLSLQAVNVYAAKPAAETNPSATKAADQAFSKRNNWRSGEGNIRDIAVSPDGTLFASASGKGVIQLRNANGKLAGILKGLRGQAVTGISFTSDSQRLVAVGEDSAVRIWDISTGKEIKALFGHEHPIAAVAINNVYDQIATVGQGTRVLVWDIKTGKLINVLSDPDKGHINSVNAVAYSQNGKFLVTGGRDGRIVIWDVNSGKVLKALLGHSGEVNAIAVFGQSKPFVVSGSSDKTVKIWDVEKGHRIMDLGVNEASIRSVAVGLDGNTLVTGSADGNIKIWNMREGKLDKVQSNGTSSVNKLLFLPNGRLLSGDDDGEINEWAVVDSQP
jgi:WD40 repeat protein